MKDNDDAMVSQEFSARVVESEQSRKQLLAMVRANQPALTDVPDEDIFTFTAEISNSQLDSYFTKMAASSLKNYAKDAQAGIAFLNSHRHGELPLGYSLNATYEEGAADDENFPRVMADFYTVRNLNITGLDTNQFINGVQFGIVRDVSIGFSRGEYVCSVCGGDMWDWDCPHIPGVMYEVIDNPEADPDSQETRDVLCFAWIEDARLSEVSAVFDGATPNAMITKARRELEAGRLKPATQRFLETQYRVKFKEPAILSGDRQSKENDKMKDEDKDKIANLSGAPDNSEIYAEMRSFARDFGLKTVRVGTQNDVMELLSEARTEITRLRGLEKDAADGVKLRKALVDDAVKEGVRANEDFDEAGQRAMLETMPVESVQSLRTSWKAIGDKTFAGKGRTSADVVDDGDEIETEGGEESFEEGFEAVEAGSGV